MPDLTWKEALRWRMHRHGLVERAPAGGLLETTARVCGLHAQVMSSAELTAAARLAEMAREAVEDALWRERTLVKLWAMRGTLHLLPALSRLVRPGDRRRPRPLVGGQRGPG